MADRKKKRSVWEDEFQDISSFSGNGPVDRRFGDRSAGDSIRSRRSSSERRSERDEPPMRLWEDDFPPESLEKRPSRNRSSARRRRQDPEWEVPQWEVSERVRRPDAGRTSPPPRDRERPSRRPVQPERHPRKPMSGHAKGMLLAGTILLMAVVTALLVIFLLFKVSDIQITGDPIEGVQNEDILAVCGYQAGDNLFFLSTGREEAELEKSFPYVGKAEILRHFPSTVEIRLTAAQVTACVSAGDQWLFVNEVGKILEVGSTPRDSVLQILGLSPQEPEPGKILQLGDENAQTACKTILTALAELRSSQDFSDMDLDSFTILDLSDLSHIRLFYGDQVEFQLGNVLDLEYKIGLGCVSLQKMQTEGMNAAGVMDLSDAGSTKKAIFTDGQITLPQTQLPSASGSEESQPSASASSTPETSSESPRDEGIPDAPYTGGSGDD